MLIENLEGVENQLKALETKNHSKTELSTLFSNLHMSLDSICKHTDAFYEEYLK